MSTEVEKQKPSKIAPFSIVKYNNPILRYAVTPADQIRELTPEAREFIRGFIETIKLTPSCAGLAAHQVGSASPIIGINHANGVIGEVLVMINPTIINFSEEKEFYSEGCLSVQSPQVQNLTAPVERSTTIVVAYQDVEMVKRIDTFTGMTARVIQHEVDHINGIFFFDRCAPLIRSMMDSKLKRIAKYTKSINYETISHRFMRYNHKGSVGHLIVDPSYVDRIL